MTPPLGDSKWISLVKIVFWTTCTCLFAESPIENATEIADFKNQTSARPKGELQLLGASGLPKWRSSCTTTRETDRFRRDYIASRTARAHTSEGGRGPFGGVNTGVFRETALLRWLAPWRDPWFTAWKEFLPLITIPCLCGRATRINDSMPPNGTLIPLGTLIAL